jgi:HlyD family secretion protein
MKLSHRTRRLLQIGLVLAVAAAAAVALWPKPVPVDVREVSRGPLEVIARHEGETRVKERYLVSMPVDGRVQRIELEPGDRLSRDETVLASIHPSAPLPLDARARAEAEAAVRAAEAAIRRAAAERDRARARQELAAAELDRIEPLAEQGVVSRTELDRARTSARAAREELAAAEAAWRRAQFELEQARAALIPTAETEGAGGAPDRVELRSPIDGVVLVRHQESSASLRAGAPLLEIGNPDRLEIVADFLSTDAVRFRPGMRAVIEEWGGEAPLEAVVRRIEPHGFLKVSALGIEEQRVNVILDFREPARGLADGYRVQVGVVTWESEDVLRVPASALFRDEEGRWAVFRVENGRAERHRVTIGHHGGLHAEVIEGLDAGNAVVAYPSDEVRDDRRVSPRASD